MIYSSKWRLVLSIRSFLLVYAQTEMLTKSLYMNFRSIFYIQLFWGISSCETGMWCGEGWSLVRAGTRCLSNRSLQSLAISDTISTHQCQNISLCRIHGEVFPVASYLSLESPGNLRNLRLVFILTQGSLSGCHISKNARK